MRRTLPCSLALAVGLSLAGEARAQSATEPAPAKAQLVEARVALSSTAAGRFAEQRLRALLELEIEDAAILAPGTSGPLGDHVAYVWIDLTATAIVVEVRVGGRPVARRELGWSADTNWDAALRLVVVSAAELVRSQASPPPVRKPPAPKRPTPDQLEQAARDADALEVITLLGASIAPSASLLLGGAGLEVALRRKRASIGVWGRFFAGDSSFGPARTLEAGLGADYRIWVGPNVRFDLGARVGFVSAYVPQATRKGTVDAHDLQLARAGGHLGLELRLDASPRAGAPDSARWLALRITPSALLGDTDVVQGNRTGAIGGLSVTADVVLTMESLARSP